MKSSQRRNNAALRWAAATAAIALTGAVALVPDYHANKKSEPQEKEAARNAGSDQSTSLTDQTDLAVTVYNSNIALIRDVRQLQLPMGSFRLKFMDIAATVNPATVHFRSLNEPDKLGVTEQNYEYDLLEPAKLLNKYVGKEVTLTRSFMDNGTTKHEEIKATLLANNNGPVWKIGNDIVTGLYGESYRFPEVPANLYERPTLLMSLENSGSRKQNIEASYLASNLSWNADYVLTVARDDKNADLDGWVTVVNNSGTAFHNARLQLVAGELNRVREEGTRGGMVEDRKMAMKAAAPQFQQESFSEYHLYSLGRKTSVEDKETKQISLLQGSGVPVEKIYMVNGQSYYYRNQQTPGAPLKDPVLVYYKFRNEEKAGLGIPLPAGNVRVYQKDSKGGILFAGEVNEPIGGDWEMLSSTYKYTKTAAFAAQFNVPVAKDGKAVLKYRIRAHW